jgi:hypothetical protein
MFGSQFEANTAPSQGSARPRLWRWLVGTTLIVAVWQVGGLGLILGSANFFDVPVEDLETFPGVAPWVAGFITLISFLPLFLVVPSLYLLLLRLPIKRLITERDRISIPRIAHGFLAMSALVIPISAIDLLVNEEQYRYTFEWKFFWPYLLIALTLLPIQTTAEEFLFRGWLLKWNNNGRLPIWFVAILNASLFALPHMFNPEIKGEYLLAFLYFASVGGMLTIATLRDRSLELAIGAHFANNFFAGVLVSYQDSALPSAAVFMTGELNWLISTATAIVMIPLFLWLTKPRAERAN